MIDPEDCRARARQLIVLANASVSEKERETYYGLAQDWLSALSGPTMSTPVYGEAPCATETA